MPTYEYEYTKADGEVVRVQRFNVPMSEHDKPVEVKDEDGKVYSATRVMSVTADMSYSWTDDVRNSDLPPVDAKPEDVTAAMNKKPRKRRNKKK